MLHPIKVVDIELSQPIATVAGLAGYMGMQGLVRLHGVPLGYVKAPVSLGECSSATLGKLIVEQLGSEIINQLLKNGLAAKTPLDQLKLEDLIDLPPAEYDGEWPLVTVAVCTRDRPEDMRRCLGAICKLDYPQLDILVIDNAPKTEATKALIEADYPQVRYVREPRPGLDWARNRAILEAKGEIIAYTDDDVAVDSGWVKGLAQVFAENLEVMAVTGLVVPYELETEAQVLFEEQGGFGKGFEQKYYRVRPEKKVPWHLLGTGNLGTGANMAYRLSVFDSVGFFDPALDVGTVTKGAGDLEMFYRILKGRHTFVYEPTAIVRHRHRESYQQLRQQLQNNGSVLSYFTCAVRSYPEDVLSFVLVILAWMKSYHLPQLWHSIFYPKQYPTELVLSELKGFIIGLTRYSVARKKSLEIESQYKGLEVDIPTHRLHAEPTQGLHEEKIKKRIGISKVEITQPIHSIKGLEKYSHVKIFVTYNSVALGDFELANTYQSIGRMRLCDSIAKNIGMKLIEPNYTLDGELKWHKHMSTLGRRYAQATLQREESDRLQLPPEISVSVVIGTFDRPADLRECLESIRQQDTPRHIEVIVVDNHPESQLTPPVVAEYPEVRLVSESRQGVAYARNAGIVSSSGDIIVTIDDDVIMSPTWLEKLIAPFTRADVVGVTGNVLPRMLDTDSQQLFEEYGGLGRGFNRHEFATSWFERSWRHCATTWELGGTANSAFRAIAFHHPEIGLMNEPLGPGMPSGVGEDIYLFYKTLKAGYTMVYEPDAQVWHKHRETQAALRRQLYNYSKGFVSYQLTTLLSDRDLRSLFNLFFYLPLYHLKRIYWRLIGRSRYPIPFVLLEIAGNLAGPWSLWRSYRRVEQAGRSSAYVPIQERAFLSENQQSFSAISKLETIR